MFGATSAKAVVSSSVLRIHHHVRHNAIGKIAFRVTRRPSLEVAPTILAEITTDRRSPIPVLTGPDVR